MALDPARLQAIGLDPNFSDPAPFGPPRPADLPQQPQQLSVLDMLRKRMARDLEDEPLQRVAEFGRGMLASGSPNFFTMLGAGAQTARQGDISRMDRLRQLAETERQERSLEGQEAARRAEEAYRQESLRLRREQAARAGRPTFQVVGQDAQGNAVVMDPSNPGQTRTLQGVTPMQALRAQPRPLSQADRAAIRNRAETLANARVGIMQGVQPTPAQLEQVRIIADALYQVMLESEGAAPSSATGAQTGGATTPAPSQTLQYGGPRIAPRQQ